MAGTTTTTTRPARTSKAPGQPQGPSQAPASTSTRKRTPKVPEGLPILPRRGAKIETGKPEKGMIFARRIGDGAIRGFTGKTQGLDAKFKAHHATNKADCGEWEVIPAAEAGKRVAVNVIG